MQKFPTIISFYTHGTPYELEVKNLLISCEIFHLEHEIEAIDSFGSWELNCAYKPFFIYKKLMDLKRAVLWVDADATFIRKPNWIEAFNSDLAVRIREELSQEHPSKVASGTIFAQYHLRALQLIKNWAQECQKQLLDPKRKEEFWDQIALRDVIFLSKHSAEVQSLPPAYAKICDHPEDCKQIQEPVIEHYQASRRLKNREY